MNSERVGFPSARIVSILLASFPNVAICSTLSYHQLGGQNSLEYEITGLRNAMTDKALEFDAARARPQGYQSEDGSGFTKPDGSKWWRFEFVCWDGPQLRDAPTPPTSPPCKNGRFRI